MGLDVTSTIQGFFYFGKLFKQVNATSLTIIPKVANPTALVDFRSIACYIVLYKIITKILYARIDVFCQDLSMLISQLLWRVGTL